MVTGFGYRKLRPWASHVLALFTFLYTPFVYSQSGPSNINISGALFDSAGTAITSPSVNFKIELYDKAGTCLIYTEDHLAIDLSQTKGAFSLDIGSGSSIQNLIDSTSTTAMSSKVYENLGVVAGGWAGCPSGATFADGDSRVIRIKYNLGGGYVTMNPDVPMAAAAYATVAQTLQGKRPSDFIQVHNDVSNKLTQANAENVFSSTNYPKLTALLAGSSTDYISASPSAAVGFNSQRIVNLADPTAAQDAATKNYADSNLGGKSVDVSGVGPATGDGYTLIWDQATQKWTTGAPTATDNTKLPLAGGTMTGAITMGGFDLLATGHITMSPLKTLTLGTFTTAQETTLVGTLTAANAGASWYNSTTKTFKIWDGTAAISQTFSGATAGGDLTGTYPNPTIANDKITSAKVDSAGVGINRLVISDQTTGGSLKFATCGTNEVLRYEGVNGWICRDPSAIVTFPVTKVNGKTGDITLNANDLGLGTAALENVGAAAGEIPVLDAGGKIPASMIPAASSPTWGDITNGAGKYMTYKPNNTACATGEVLEFDGTNWICADISALGTGDFKKDGSVAMTGNFNAGGNSILGNTTASANLTLDSTSNATKGYLLLQPNGGNVGVGTNNPATLLDVNGYATIRKSATVGGGSDAAADLVVSNSTSSSTFGWYPSINLTNTLPGQGDSTSTYNRSGLQVSAGNGAVGAGIFSYYESGVGNYSTMGTSTNHPLVLMTNGTERVRLLTSGNLGVGTNNPARLLHVNGPMRITPAALPGTPAAGDLAFDSGAANALKFYDGSAWQTVGTGTGSGDFMKDGSVAMTGNFNAGGNSILGNTTASANLTLESTSNATKGYVLIQPNGGNVGIGTNTPAMSFDVQGTSTVGASSGYDLGGATLLVNPVADQQTAGVGTTSNTAWKGSAQVSSSATHKINTVNGIYGEAVNAEAGKEVATLNGVSGWAYNQGNSWVDRVMSGVSAASEVDSGVVTWLSGTYNWSGVYGGSVDQWYGMRVDMDFATAGSVNGRYGVYLGAPTGGRTPTNDYGFYQEGTQKNYFAGNIGIGTNSPGRLLHVNGAARLTPTTTPSTPAAGDLFFDSAASNALKYYNGSAWQTVGTGTGSGDFMKDGSVAMTGNFNAGGNSILGNTTASANLKLESTSNATKGYVLIQPNGGNVGIGTTAPTSPVDIQGTDTTNTFTAGEYQQPLVAHKLIVSPAANITSSNYVKAATYSNAVVPNSATKNIDSLAGHQAIAQVDASNISGYRIFGSSSIAELAGSNLTFDTAFGGDDELGIDAATSTITNGYGTRSGLWQSTGTVTNAYGAYDLYNPTGGSSTDAAAVLAETKMAGGTVTTLSGLQVKANITGGTVTNRYGIFINTQSGSATTKDFALYSAATQDSYFAGKVGIGTTAPATALDVNGAISTRGIAAPALSPAGQGRIYFDSTSNQFMVSQNGGAYASLATTGGSGGGQTSTSSLTFNSDSDNSGSDGGYSFQAHGSPLLTVANNGDTAITSTTAASSSSAAALTVAGGLGVGSNIVASGVITGNGLTSNATDPTVYTSTSVTVAVPNGPFMRSWNSSSTNGATASMFLSPKNSSNIQQNAYFSAYSISGASAYTPVIVIGQQTGATAYSERMRIDTNGYLGIGTTAPGRLLHVNGPMRMTPAALPSTPAAGDLAFDSAASNALKFYDGSAWQTVGTGTGSGDFKKDGSVAMTGNFNAGGNSVLGNTTANANLTLESTSNATKGFVNIQPNGGNVGIGTASPAVSLHVVSDSGAKIENKDLSALPSTLVFYRNRNGGAVYDGLPLGSLDFKGADDSSIERPAAKITAVVDGTPGNVDMPGRLEFYTTLDGTVTPLERMRITNDGKIGIGTTAPTRLLDVAGPIHITPAALPSTPTAGELAFDSAASNALKFYNGSAWQTVGTGTGSGDFKKDGSVAMTGNFNAGGNSILGNSTASANLTLESTSNATKGLVNIQPNGGNVGIGTSTPNVGAWPSTASVLTVMGNGNNGASSSGILELYGTQTDANTNLSGALVFGAKGNTTAPPIATISSYTSGSTATNRGGILTFFTKPDGSSSVVEAMRIDQSGNVAIGNMGAVSRLDVQGSGSTSSTFGFGVRNSSGTYSLAVRDDGNLGVGTLTPTRLLDVAGPIHILPAALPSTPTAGDLAFDSGASNALKYYNGSAWQTVGTGTGNGDFKKDGSVAMTGNFNAGGNSILGNTTASANLTLESTSNATKGYVLLQPNGGNVGIGTATPTSALDVRGVSGDVTSLGVMRFNSNNGTNDVGMKLGAIAGAGSIGYSFIQSMHTGVGNDANLILNPSGSGNVGIGTTSPGYPLDVSGNMRASGYFVNANTVGLHWGANESVTGHAGAHYVAVTTNGSERIRVDSSGNVGVGTNSPARTLHVNGAARLTPTTTPSTPAAGDIFFDSAASNALKFYNGSAWQTVATGSGSGDFMKDGSVPMTGTLKMGGNTIYGNSTASGTLTLDSTSSATKGHIVLFPGGLTGAYAVGIGTTTPSSALYIQQNIGNTETALTIDNQSNTAPAGAQVYLKTVLGNTSIRHESGNAAVGYLEGVDQSDGKFKIAAYPGAPSYTTPSITVDGVSKLVGIGTSSPARLLHVSGPMRITPAALPSSPAAGDLAFDSGASNALKYYNGSAWVSAGGGGSSQWTTSGSNIYYNTGNVGIGTSSPSAALTVQTAPGGGFLMLGGNDPAAAVAAPYLASQVTSGFSTLPLYSFWYQDTTGISNPANNAMGFVANGTEAMRITSTGKVGIGTTSARGGLDVSNGSLVTKAATSNATSTIDFSTGNMQYTASSCGAFQLNNLKDGGSYSFAVQSATSATCSFTAFSDAGTTSLTVHMPPDHTATIASKHTLYTFMVMGTHMYVTWIPGM